MNQLNMQMTAEFQRDLEVAMKKLGARSKSEAIRLAVREMAKKPPGGGSRITWHQLLEAARNESPRKSRRFASHAEVWGTKSP